MKTLCTRLFFATALLVLAAAVTLHAETLAHPDDASKQVEYFVGKPDGDGPWPTLVLLHGHQEDPRPGAQGTEAVLNRFAKRGVLAVAVSLPGYGNSTGPPDFCGPLTQHAVSAVIAKLRADGWVAPGKLVLQGVSRGAVTAGLVAANDPTIAGLIMISGECDLASLAADSAATGIKAAVRQNLLDETGGSADALRARSVINFAKDIKAATLIMNGGADDRTNPDNARRLAEEINRGGGSARVVIYPGSGHSVSLEERRKETEPFLVSLWGDAWAADRTPGQSAPNALGGTWTGTSTCVGNRPACKNETVVYRFVPLEGHPGQVRLLADKILEGKRVPMSALVFDFDARAGTLRSEFTRGDTHGVWSFTVAGNSMTGELIILPEGARGRDVKVHRVKDDDVPPAPAIQEYEE